MKSNISTHDFLEMRLHVVCHKSILGSLVFNKSATSNDNFQSYHHLGS